MKTFLQRNSFVRTCISLCIISYFIFSPLGVFAALPAPIQTDPLPPVPVADSAIRTKEYSLTILGRTIPGISLDKLAIIIFKEMLERMSDAIVEYINNDFRNPDGSNGPAFAIDFEGFLLNVGDEIAGEFIENIGAGVVCSPFKAQIQSSLRLRFQTVRSTDPAQTTCTLTGSLQNIENFFAGDFSAGGWQTWFEVTQNQSNNPVGAFLQLEGELAYRIQSARETESEKIGWGDGFLSFEECVEEGPNGTCKVKNVRTPGRVIEGQLQSMLGSEIAQLELADEFDEIISALAGQLVAKVFGNEGLIINGPTNPWAGGGYGNNPTTSSGAQCYPNIQSGFISASTTVTWTVQSFGGTNPSYVWSGDEGLSGTGQNASIIYQTAGRKRAQVQVTDTRMVSGVPQTSTQTVQCNPEVEMQRWLPIKGECVADKQWALPGEPVLFTIRITQGGSGVFSYQLTFPWPGPDTPGTEDDAVTPFAPFPNPLTRMLSWLIPGSKGVRVRIVDNERTVAPITINCDTVDIIR